jgi:signal transduction histidine kinase
MTISVAIQPAVSALPALRLLCVEDNPNDVELIGLALKRADPGRTYLITHVEEARGFTENLGDDIDVVLCDYNMPLFSPDAALTILAQRGSQIPLVVVTHAIGEEAAVGVLRHGAKDYVSKSKLATLPQIIDRVMSERHALQKEERLRQQLAAAYARLRELSSRAVLTQERERSLISRELHDVLGQTLTAVVIHMHASRAATDPDKGRVYSDMALQLAQEAVHQVRTMSFSLRPAQLDLLGLIAAVESTVHRMADAAGLKTSITTRGVQAATLDHRASVAVRLIQEAVTNTVRHASATRIWVRLRFLPSGPMVLLIADNGTGFDPRSILDGPPGEHNVGLYGMMERAELIGGKLRIRTELGAGVIVRAIL